MRAAMSLARLGVRLYYRETRLGETIPGQGPVVLVGNHPNGLVDPVVIAGITTRRIRFLGKAPLFAIPVLGGIMRGLKVLPVYRQQDGSDLTRNEKTFDAVFDALQAGDVICLFPEGKSHNEPELQKLKTGAARMALGAEARSGFRLGVKVVPIGLMYRAKRRFGSPVATWVGEPIEARDLRELHAEDDRKAVIQLTDRIARALGNVTLSLDRWEDLPLLELAEHILPPDERDRIERLQAFAAGVRKLRERRDDRLDLLSERVASFHQRLSHLGIPVQDLGRRYRPMGMLRFVLRNLIRWLIGFPLACAGALFWFLPYRFIPWLTKRLTQDRDIHATYQILAGAVLFPVWLLSVSAFAYLRFHPRAGIAGFVLAPLFGLFALAFLDWRSEVIEDVRVFLRLGLRKQLRRRLLDERDAIAAEITALRRDFLSAEEALSAPDESRLAKP